MWYRIVNCPSLLIRALSLPQFGLAVWFHWREGQPDNVDFLVANHQRQLLSALPHSGNRLPFELQYLIAQGGRLFEL